MNLRKIITKRLMAVAICTVQHPQLKEADKRALCVTLNKIKLKQ